MRTQVFVASESCAFSLTGDKGPGDGEVEVRKGCLFGGWGASCLFCRMKSDVPVVLVPCGLCLLGPRPSLPLPSVPDSHACTSPRR